MKHLVTLISGTNRTGNRTLPITRHLQSVYQELGADTHLLDLTQLPCDAYLPTSYAEKPDSLAPWTGAVLDAAGLVVVVPEYNGSFPGALKYFIDLLPFPESFEDRPVCFVGLASGSWGALRAVEHLQGIFGYRNAHIFPKRVFLPQIHASVDAGGAPDEESTRRLRAQAAGFLEYIRKLRGKTA